MITEQTQTALADFLKRQAEANASIRPAQQALDTLDRLGTESTPTSEGNQYEE